MVRKKYKMALSSLVLSSLTLIVLATSFLIPSTDFGKNLSFFNTSELQSDLEKSYLEIDKLISEKEFLMKELKQQLEKVQFLKTENDSLKTELDVKHQQIESLIFKIESLEKDVSKLMTLKRELAKAKKQYETAFDANSNSKKEETIEENTVAGNMGSEIKKENKEETITNKVTSTESPIRDIIREYDGNIRLLNSKVQTYHKRSNGIKKETTTASKVNSLELEYTLYVDKTNEKKTNVFYVQVFDTNNKNVGKTKSYFIGDKELVYSFVSNIEYVDQVSQVKQEFSTEGLNLEKGVYFLNIFSSKGKLLCSRSFKLD
ncbi:hypothetical protein [Flavobacterium sp. J27]|uniref:hypothetical protein n=1 Tax=Flavobacterium sp. J27 TaxID=2060419 RepID=UPI0010300B30|nr:hypothetical protein [Flavobacterium sp. J27]